MFKNKFPPKEPDVQPWVSFCLATYQRPDKLQNVLASIAKQDFSDFEVIISDNDPQMSSKRIVDGFADSRFRYLSTQQNIGMIKNFNKAISHACGEFIVMITDDDPIYPEMLKTLHTLSVERPGFGAYYGACDVIFETNEIAETYQTKAGKKSYTISQPRGSVRSYSSEDFPTAFFGHRIFPYMLWSTGIIRRKIVIENEGVPDYGSPFLADFAYLALAGERQGFVAVNVPLGYQAIHGKNSGFSDPHSLVVAVKGCHDYIDRRLSSRRDWKKIRNLMEKYLAIYAITHTIAMQRFYRIAKISSPKQHTVTSTAELVAVPYIKRHWHFYYILRIFEANPALRRVYGYLQIARRYFLSRR
jgi:glycosyltransferase involved in cell wall biosynthesis